MKPVNKDILVNAAENLMFQMSDDQYETLLKEFDIILKQMSFISKIKGVDEAKPMVFPFDVTNTFLREDEFETSLPRDEALKNSKDVVDGQIRLPKVVG